jgi:hypothetical protein
MLFEVLPDSNNSMPKAKRGHPKSFGCPLLNINSLILNFTD